MDSLGIKFKETVGKVLSLNTKTVDIEYYVMYM